MKKDNELMDSFLKSLKSKVPNRATLANLLIEMLCIEREAVYRRLRGEVAFTFSEVALIASKLGISLDNTISNTLSTKSRPFQLKMLDFANPRELDYIMMEQYLDILKSIRHQKESTLIESTNILPFGLYSNYETISRFYLLKWMYQSGELMEHKKLEDINYPERVLALESEHFRYLRYIKDIFYILDPLIFQYMATDIKYFADINLISPKDVELLKKDFLRLLDEIERIATRGYGYDADNKIHIYISCVNFDTSYWLLETETFNMSLVKVFLLNNIASLDENVFMRLKRSMEALLRTSTMISISGEKQRHSFIEEQRRIIETL